MPLQSVRLFCQARCRSCAFSASAHAVYRYDMGTRMIRLMSRIKNFLPVSSSGDGLPERRCMHCLRDDWYQSGACVGMCIKPALKPRRKLFQIPVPWTGWQSTPCVVLVVNDGESTLVHGHDVLNGSLVTNTYLLVNRCNAVWCRNQ